MATTKASTAVESALTLTASTGDDTGASQDLQAGYGATLYVKLTNGATGPTIAAQVQIEASGDGSDFMAFGNPLVGSTANSAVTSWTITIPPSVEHVRTVQGSNTGQDVTLSIDLSHITAIS